MVNKPTLIVSELTKAGCEPYCKRSKKSKNDCEFNCFLDISRRTVSAKLIQMSMQSNCVANMMPANNTPWITAEMLLEHMKTPKKWVTPTATTRADCGFVSHPGINFCGWMEKGNASVNNQLLILVGFWWKFVVKKLVYKIGWFFSGLLPTPPQNKSGNLGFKEIELPIRQYLK